MKNYIIKFRFIALLFLGFYASAGIVEISNIKDILNYLDINQRSIVVFDIDNTLLRPTTSLGSDEWFSSLVEENLVINHEIKLKNSKDVISAVNKSLPLYFHVNSKIDLIPTELDLSKDVRDIESCCGHTICLTARSLKMVDITLKQLEKNGLVFKVPELSSQDLIMKFNYPCTYKEGVLFCGNNDKGKILLFFLDNINYIPEHIIFVDDKIKNIKSVEKASISRGLKFTGFLYTGCEKFVKSFNKDLVNKELEKFLSKYPFNFH